MKGKIGKTTRGNALGSTFRNHTLVHVVEQREVDGVATVMRDETKITGMPRATAPAPSVDGAIFTHWTISTQQDFAVRDAWGRPSHVGGFGRNTLRPSRVDLDGGEKP